MRKREKAAPKKRGFTGEAPLWMRIFIICIVILALLFLIFNSMSGLNWYPGASFYDK